jgi:hypothetical protein
MPHHHDAGDVDRAIAVGQGQWEGEVAPAAGAQVVRRTVTQG